MAKNGHSSGNGHQARALASELMSSARALQAQVDRAVALADQEIGIRDTGHGTGETLSATALPPFVPNPQLPNPGVINMPGAQRTGMPGSAPGAVPPNSVPPVPAPEPISVQTYTERVKAGWVPIMGVPGTPITGGFIRELGEYNPKIEGLNGIWTYQEMRRGDGQIAGTLRASKLPVLSAKWTVEAPPDTELKKGQSKAKADEVVDFVKSNLLGGLEWQDHRGSWHTQDFKDAVRCALRMQDFGASALEEVMTVDGGNIRCRRLADRQALTFYRWHTDPHDVDPSLTQFVYDDGETLYAIEQWGYRSNRFEYVMLPTDKACVFTHDQEGANFWGIPLTRAMYPHWFIVHHLERIDAIANERNGMGVPMIMLPPNPSRQDVQTAQNWVTQLAAHEKTGLSLPNGAEFKLVGIEGQVRQIIPSIEYHRSMIAQSALQEFRQLGQKQSGSGSKALGGEQKDFFLLSQQYTADYIAAQIRNGTIRRLVLWNFGPDAPVPYLRPGNVQARSIETAASIISSLAMAGAWISDRNSVNQARHEMGFDDFVDEDVVAIKGETIGAGPGAISGKGGMPIMIGGATQAAPAADNADSTDQTAAGGKQKAAAGNQPAKVKASVQCLEPHAPKLLSSARPVRLRDTVSPLWRDGDDPRLKKVHKDEVHIDFGAHQAAIDRAQTAVKSAIETAKPGMVRAAARAFAAALKGAQPLHTVVVDYPTAAVEQVAQQLAKAYQAGKSEAFAEHQRLHEAKRIPFNAGVSSQETGGRSQEPGVTRLDDSAPLVPAPKTKPRLFAELRIQDVAADVTQAARKAALDVAADDLTGKSEEDLAYDLNDQINDTAYVDQGIQKAAGEAASSAFRAGRSDAFSQIVEALKKVGMTVQLIRVGVLDKNICDPCESADGEEIDLGEDLSAICEGGDLCRCQAAEVGIG